MSDVFQKVKQALLELTTTSVCPRPVAGGVVVNKRVEVVLVYSTYAGQGWHFPKGGVDEGETLLDCAIREAQEEGGVTGKAVPTLNPFELDPGTGFFVEPLAWGSPRKGRATGKINQGTANLIREAVIRAGVCREGFDDLKYAIFDLFGRELSVRWQSVPTYFVLAFDKDFPNPDGESQKVRWASLEEVKMLVYPHSQAGRLLACPGFKQAVEEAASQ
jgi:8-oxo-dGTP pyrophosphatase MutT (NUDIX family)